jgi:methanogenic corrinoid protein MtbC1
MSIPISIFENVQVYHIYLIRSIGFGGIGMDPFLELDRHEMIEYILNAHFERNPMMKKIYNEVQIERSREDIGYHLDFIDMAIKADSEVLFIHYLRWLKGLFTSLGLDEIMVVEHFEVMKENISEKLGEGVSSKALDLLDIAIRDYPTYPEDVQRYIPLDGPNTPYANEYLNLLMEGKRYEAMQLILGLVDSGTSIKDIYIDIFEKVQKEIGALWQMNQVTVAQEHYMTASTQLIMAQLYPHVFNKERKERSMIATCAPGELHEIGIRMVTDFFEMEGWETYYLGANTPLESLVKTVVDKKPDILAISSTIPTHIDSLKRIIDAVKEACKDDCPKILVGGFPFLVDQDLWKKVGSDGTAMNATEAIKIASEIST